MSEKRRLERFHLSMPSRIQSAGGHAGEASLVLKTQDVCSGGAFFTTTSGLPEGTPVRVEMVMPTERFQTLGHDVHRVLIQMEGTVLRSGRRGMAVRFGDTYRFCPVNGQAMASATIFGQSTAEAL